MNDCEAETRLTNYGQRTTVVGLRLRPAERREWNRLARRHGLGLSDTVRLAMVKLIESDTVAP